MRVEARGWSGEEKEMKARDSVFLLHRQTYTHQLMPISSTKVRQEKIQNLEKACLRRKGFSEAVGPSLNDQVAVIRRKSGGSGFRVEMRGGKGCL